jgi:hypothetical protein
MKTKIYLFVLLVLFCSPFASALFCSNTYYIKKVYDVDLNSTSLEYISANLGNWSADKPNYNTTTELSNIFALATQLTNFFSKTEVNSTGFIGLTCSNNQIMKWGSGRWECATDSGGISAIYSGDSYTYITGGDTVNVNTSTTLNWTGNASFQSITINGETITPYRDGILIGNESFGIFKNSTVILMGSDLFE